MLESINALINVCVFDYCVIDYNDRQFIEEITIYKSESRENVEKRVYFVLDYDGELLEMKTILKRLED